MAIVTRIRKSGPVYSVSNRIPGQKQPAREPVGSDRREAMRRDAAMKKEIKAGIYVGKPTGAKTVGAYAEGWLAERNTRSLRDDVGRFKNHVVKRCPWFVELKLEDVRVSHVIRLAKELALPYVNAKGKTRTLAPRAHANIFKSLLGPMFRDARMAELMVRNVCELPRGTLNGSSKRRKPYAGTTVAAMTTDARIDLDCRMFCALLFYTGTRVGEACGLRFSDYDTETQPLGALVVSKQYNGEALKTDTQVDGAQTRWIPVHPFLAAALDEWRRTGFEMVYCRKPTPVDFIVPRRSDSARCHSKSSAYEMFQAALARLGIENQTVHATRNTFITLCRRAGARSDVLEQVTHNAAGKVIDIYTDFDWQPLCDAVACFMTRLPTTVQRQPVRHLHAV
jgi:integrase